MSMRSSEIVTAQMTVKHHAQISVVTQAFKHPLLLTAILALTVSSQINQAPVSKGSLQTVKQMPPASTLLWLYKSALSNIDLIEYLALISSSDIKH